ncbi:GyrI-like domain-containing protein [Glaciihabitans tibetensis]
MEMADTGKVDFRKERPDLYAPGRKEFSIVEVPPFDFLIVDGHGDPNTSPDYVHALEALYALSYAAKFANKAGGGRDYVVAPLEGLWHSEHRDAFPNRAKDQWSWTMMIRQPSWITDEIRDAARATSAKKNLPALPKVGLQHFEEGKSVQILHVGSYDDEGPTIARLHAEFLPAEGFVENGLHHEIYLSDPRKTDAARLRTVLRQPVRPKHPPIPLR